MRQAVRSVMLLSNMDCIAVPATASCSSASTNVTHPKRRNDECAHANRVRVRVRVLASKARG